MTNEEALNILHNSSVYHPMYLDALNMAIEALEQEPKTGHWIEGQTDNPNIHNILCSCCFEGYPSKGHANSQYTKGKFRWCPNCGARMAEVESEDKDADSN